VPKFITRASNKRKWHHSFFPLHRSGMLLTISGCTGSRKAASKSLEPLRDLRQPQLHGTCQPYCSRWHPNVFDDAGLESLKYHLPQLSGSDSRIVSVKGNAIDRTILKSDWVLLYLTDGNGIHRLSRLVGKSIRIKPQRALHDFLPR
jgi:hypothetical protein